MRSVLFSFFTQISALTLLGAAGIVAVTAILLHIIPQRWQRDAKGVCRRIARGRITPLYIGLFVLSVRLALVPFFPIPRPMIADEFSYLLLGGTLASGKLVNPPHPLWPHFETLFVLNQPVYASVYPLAQGLTLALGIVTSLGPWWGVWLSSGLMCAAICWMLRGWVPPEWALFGGFLAALQLGIFGYWMNSFWGGCTAATGGALVFGALPRMQRRSKIRDGLICGLGLAILANSRPYEGFLLALPVAVWCIRGWRRIRVPAVALVAVLAIAAVLDGYYFRRVTGSAFKIPYQAYIEQYAAAPAFLWQREPPVPVYRHAVLRDAHLAFRIDYRQFQSISGFARVVVTRLGRLGSFYFGPLWLIPVLTLPGLIRIGKIRILLISVLIPLAGIMLAAPFWPHYAAPMTAIFIAIEVESLRLLSAMKRRGFNIGRYLIPSALLVCLFGALFTYDPSRFHSRLTRRPDVIENLRRSGPAHLVFVRYGSHHALGEEWVYNEPDIDAAPIVWARDMGAERNEELRHYYSNRAHWILEPDDDPPRLTPYQ